MPELPEVEVVKKSLQKRLTDLKIKDVKIINRNLRYKLDEINLKKLKNKKIIKVKRRSKYILIDLNNAQTILIHLGMTGKFFFNTKLNQYKKLSFYYQDDTINNKHNHIIFNFNRFKLIYNDVRKFGFIKLFRTYDIFNNNHLKKLGPEPLSKKFNVKYFKIKIHKKNRKIKDILMDQKFIAGLGNIYVNEILFLSKINPSKVVQKLTFKNITRIIKYTKFVLKKSIKLGGSSIKDFKNTSGIKGKFQQNFNVYGRSQLNCIKSNCRGIIKRILISKRSTYYCNICQK